MTRDSRTSTGATAARRQEELEDRPRSIHNDQVQIECCVKNATTNAQLAMHTSRLNEVDLLLN